MRVDTRYNTTIREELMTKLTGSHGTIEYDERIDKHTHEMNTRKHLLTHSLVLKWVNAAASSSQRCFADAAPYIHCTAILNGLAIRRTLFNMYSFYQQKTDIVAS